MRPGASNGPRRHCPPSGAILLAVASLAVASGLTVAAGRAPAGEIVVAARPDNDVVVAAAQCGIAMVRVDNPAEAVARAADGDGLLVLADGYPDAPTPLDAAFFAAAARKRLRMFVEYPSWLPGMTLGSPRGTHWERAVVSDDFFAGGPGPRRILAIPHCRFLPVDPEPARPHLVVGRVAGFDTAVHGLPTPAHPILFELPTDAGDGNEKGAILVATTRLSGVTRGRLAPHDAWRGVWGRILAFVAPGAPLAGLDWTPAVRPTFGPDEPLPADAERRALARGIRWYSSARMLVHPGMLPTFDRQSNGPEPPSADPDPAAEWPWGHRVAAAPVTPPGDGSLGVLEGFDATIFSDGTQPVRWWRRADCNGESAGAMAAAGKALDDSGMTATAGRIGDWLVFHSRLTGGERADPDHPAHGLIGWNDTPEYCGPGSADGAAVYYGDDEARTILGLELAAGLLGTDRYDQRVLEALLANLRLAGPGGFLPDRLDGPTLDAAGWRGIAAAGRESLSPHYQACMWACHLLAFRQTGFAPFRDRARRAIETTMQAYPDRWVYTTGLQQERAKMLLALAWLVRVDDSPRHREWLDRIAADLLSTQAPGGAIRDVIAPPGGPGYHPPATNDAYGTAEAPLIQSNDDSAADLLYTCNFAFLALHEAAAVTGDPRYRDAEDALAAFLCRSQITSDRHPELDGGWFRAFDLDAWEYWASSTDAGWGAWCLETGWSQSWITAVLALRALDTSLWDVAATSTIGRRLPALRARMLPDGP